METIPRKALWAVVAALIGLAGIGAFQGMQRGAADQAAVEAGVLPTPGTVAAAKNAAPLSESLAGLTEAQVREIARQEARSVIGRPAPSTSDDERAPTVGPAAPPRNTASAPAPAAPPPSAPPADAGQPPLF